MKTLLKMLLGLAVGVVIGLGIAYLIIILIDGPDAMENLKTKDVGIGELALSVAVTFVALIVAVVIQFALHETGHALGGLATGFRFLSIRLFKFAIVRDTDGKLRYKKFSIAGTGGQCLMDFGRERKPKDIPYFWYNAGGVVMNILSAVVAIIMLRTSDLSMVGESFCMMTAFAAILLGGMNGIPLTLNGLSNDGRNIMLLWRDKKARVFFFRMMQMAGGLSRGERLKDMPAEWFEDVKPRDKDDYFAISNRLNFMTWLEDQGRYSEARAVCEELDGIEKLPQLLCMEKNADHILLELLTTGRKDVVDRILTKQTMRYLEANKAYSPMKTAALFAVNLLCLNDKAKAVTLYEELLAKKNDYLMPGEALMAIEMAERIKLAEKKG